jgi:lysophospholipase L1-like esterase
VVGATSIALLIAVIELSVGFFLSSPSNASSGRASETDRGAIHLASADFESAPLREEREFLWHNEPLATRTQLVNPQVQGLAERWTIENNSLGFRGSELRSGSSARGVYRILCIGDSTTFGFNVDQHASYPAQLTGFLRALQPDRDFEVINAGVPGWTWLQGVRFLERRGLALDPDVVIMAHGVNDQLMPTWVTDAEHLEPASDPWAMRIGKLRDLVADTNIYHLIEQRFDIPPAYVRASPGCQRQLDAEGVCKRVALEEIGTAVATAARLARVDGIELLILNLDFMKTGAALAVRKAAETAGVRFVDQVRQFEFEGLTEQLRRSDGLRLKPAGDRALMPFQGPLVRERRVIFRLQTADTTASYSTRGRRTIDSVPDAEFNHPLNDEGLDGDEKQGDGVFSGTLILPPGISTLDFVFYREESPEFQSLPTMDPTIASRSLRVIYNQTTPVHRFGERSMMVDEAHPNAEGYAVIADAVTFAISWLPGFEHWAAEAGVATGAPPETAE